MSDQPEKLGPPPVEPMTPQAWHRIERGLWKRMDAAAQRDPEPARRPVRRALLVAVPLFAAAAVLAVIVSTQRPSGTELRRDQPSRVLASETETSVSFGEAYITVEPRGVISTREEQRGPAVVVDEGAARFVVAPRTPKSPFTVRAGGVTVRVIGTEFRVARFGESVTVSVERGIVDVEFQGRITRVAAGHAWSTSVPSETAPIKVTITPPPPTPDAAPHAPAVDEPAPPLAKVPPFTRDAQERTQFDRLTALEATNPKEAFAGYLVLSRGTSSWSGVALFAAGRLAADRHDPQAKSLLETYLRRFPRGANAGDARDLLTRLASSADADGAAPPKGGVKTHPGAPR